VSNLAIANDIIRKCNNKFVDGTANLKSSIFDEPELRINILKSFREKDVARSVKELEDSRALIRSGQSIRLETERTKALTAGRVLDESSEAKVGNCGERSLWCAYKLVEDGVPNVSILQGNVRDSINHTFVVIGATNIPESDKYMINRVPKWSGDDIVICEPWFQNGSWLDYSFGVAYKLNNWPEMMPKIVSAASSKKIALGQSFELLRLM